MLSAPRSSRERSPRCSLRSSSLRGCDARSLLTCLLLAGDGLLRTLAGAGVGLGALAVHRQAAAMPQPLVATDLDLAADVCCDLAAQVTLDAVVRVDVVA